jgi:hypothetical protein
MKARRLARLCEVVFLIEQPYNKPSVTGDLPYNVVCCKGWGDIYEYLRDYF